MHTTNPNPLSTRCMLVHLAISMWGGKRLDRDAGRAAASAANADNDAFDAVLNLMPRKALAPVVAAANALRINFYTYTLPWLDGGFRALSSPGYFKFVAKHNELKGAFASAVADLAPIYEHIKDTAPQRLGSAYRASDFPNDIQRKFAVNLTVTPFPDSADFRVAGLTPEVTKDITNGIDSEAIAISEAARQEILDRIVGTVSKVAERLKAYTGKREGSFRDTLITNVGELADILPLLNIDQDPRIDTLINDVKALSVHDPENLRGSVAYRDQVIHEANGILNSLGSFLPGPTAPSVVAPVPLDLTNMSAF